MKEIYATDDYLQMIIKRRNTTDSLIFLWGLFYVFLWTQNLTIQNIETLKFPRSSRFPPPVSWLERERERRESNVCGGAFSTVKIIFCQDSDRFSFIVSPSVTGS